MRLSSLGCRRLASSRVLLDVHQLNCFLQQAHCQRAGQVSAGSPPFALRTRDCQVGGAAANTCLQVLAGCCTYLCWYVQSTPACTRLHCISTCIIAAPKLQHSACQAHMSPPCVLHAFACVSRPDLVVCQVLTTSASWGRSFSSELTTEITAAITHACSRLP